MLEREIIVNETLDEMEEDQLEMITLNMEDGSSVDCAVLGIFEIEEQDYIALLPLSEDLIETNESEGFIFRYSEDEEGLPVLDPIEDDEEFAMVSEVLDEIMEITVEEEIEEE